MSRLDRIRWRLAHRIAPCPILRAPDAPGPAILWRDEDSTDFVAWLTPSTLNVEMSTTLPSFADDTDSPAAFRPHQTTGTITGTIG